MESGTGVTVSIAASNADLIERCRIGDAAAWDELVRRYQRLVYAIPIREGLDLDEAAEVTQQTFAALVKELNNIRDPGRLASWLMTVARREVWRSRRREGDSNPFDISTVEAEQEVDDKDWTDRQAEIAWVYDAVQTLGEPCRSLILGLFFDPSEPSYATVAVRIGRPIGSIGPLRARCLERLRQALEAGLVERG